ncbi:hypothetical protein ACU635_50855 [[Actinomadura] parvosata]|uniref:hypothetical protein n=1 Tax=[Actinomadura] parvosata TaxID=1955412 RepID=UPI00406CD21A
MTDRQTVYRSFAPKVLAHWRDAEAAVVAWRQKVRVTLAELGVDDRNAMVNSLTGVIVGLDHAGEPPEGWRLDGRTGYIVPRLNTKAGRLIGAALDELRRPDPREALPGMPKDCRVGNRLRMCAVRPMKGALYATWGGPIPERVVDLTLWQPVKLSEYWAVVELEESEAADA